MAPTAQLYSYLPLFVSLATTIHASQTPLMPPLSPHQDDISPVPPHLIAALKPYTWYAATTACNLSAIMDWNCGENCDANPTFKPIAVGGNNEETPFWFAGYDPTRDEVIVSHYGTDFNNQQSVRQNLLFSQVPLDSEKLFPGIDKSIQVHQGYAGVQSRSANAVIAAVEQALSQSSTKKVTVVGHSMGAAVALLDAVYLSLHLPSDVAVRYVGYSSPRVGNEAFADYVDARPGLSVTRINNKQDPIPVLPWRKFFQYHFRHASGEIHIRNDDVWVLCPGQDNPSDQCSTGAVTEKIIGGNGNMTQHTGPFDGITMGECSET